MMPARKRSRRDRSALRATSPKRTHSVAHGTAARLDPFARGHIWGLYCGGVKQEDIAAEVFKKDGTAVSQKAVEKVIATKKQYPGWRGADSRAGGRPPAISEEQKQELIDLVFKERGGAVVTVKYCRKKLKFLRPLAPSTVCRYLHEAGYLHESAATCMRASS